VKLRLALFVACASGFVALSYEILWYRLFAFVTEGAPLAFGALLGAYLIGIAFGSFLSRTYCEETSFERTRRALWLFLAFANGVAFLVTPLLARTVTGYPWFLGLFYVVIAASLLGAIFPLTSHLAIPPDDRAGARLSYLYLANILGSCAGSLATGFLAMDHLDTRQLAVGLALLGFSLALAVCLATEPKVSTRSSSALAVVLLSALCVASSSPAFDQLYERLHYKKEFTASTRFAETVENKSGVINVSADGKVYGGGAYDGVFNTELGNDKNWIARAYAVGVLHPRPKRMLMIGLSSGSWAKVLSALPGLEQFTIVEINPGYLSLIEHHPEVSSVLTDPKIHVVIDDGRRWLESHPDDRFDAVVMNMTWHWRAHATDLLSREFFEIVKAHLAPGGLFYFNTTSSKDACMTAIAVFPHTLRVRNFVAGSDAPLALPPAAWTAFLESYALDGVPVLGTSPAERAATLAGLIAYAEPGGIQAKLEEEESLKKTCGPGEVITDDNMLPEWRELIH
jgi:spermidine synthase